MTFHDIVVPNCDVGNETVACSAAPLTEQTRKPPQRDVYFPTYFPAPALPMSSDPDPFGVISPPSLPLPHAPSRPFPDPFTDSLPMPKTQVAYANATGPEPDLIV